MKTAVELSFAILAIILLGCSCKELPKVEEFEVAPEVIEEATEFDAIENSLQEIELNALEKIRDVETMLENEMEERLFEPASAPCPGGNCNFKVINCYAGVMEFPIHLPCFGSCVTASINGTKMAIGCSTRHINNGCWKPILGFLKLCFCDEELCNPPS